MTERLALNETLSAEEAARVTGISVQTLMRFAELGYLRAEAKGINEFAFRRSDLEQFIPEEESSTYPGPEGPESSADEPTPSAAATDQDADDNSAMDLQARGHGNTAEQVLTQDDVPGDPVQTRDPVKGPTTAKAGETGDQENIDHTALAKAKALIKMVRLQEEVIALKEREATDLREQRDWLRRRVEQLEEQAGRDQVLLLTGSRTIQKLVESQQPLQRRSAVRALLEYFGIVTRRIPESQMGTAFQIGSIRDAHQSPNEDVDPSGTPSEGESHSYQSQAANG